MTVFFLLKVKVKNSLAVQSVMLASAQTDCVECPKLCKHMVVVDLYRILPVIIGTDEITGATAQHVRCVLPSKYVCI